MYDIKEQSPTLEKPLFFKGWGWSEITLSIYVWMFVDECWLEQHQRGYKGRILLFYVSSEDEERIIYYVHELLLGTEQTLNMQI